MTLVAKSDQSTGNALFASYVLQSHELVFSFTAPYSRKAPRQGDGGALPGYSQEAAYEFLNMHGLAARAVGERAAPARIEAVSGDSGGPGVGVHARPLRAAGADRPRVLPEVPPPAETPIGSPSRQPRHRSLNPEQIFTADRII